MKFRILENIHRFTVSCLSCGWKQSNFIPAEEKEPSKHSLVVNTPEPPKGSSCEVFILHNPRYELDLEVNPGAESTGYVSNVEGVSNDFSELLGLSKHQSISEQIDEEITALEEMENMLINHDFYIQVKR